MSGTATYGVKMKRFALTAALLLLTTGTLWAAGLTYSDLDPAKGDKGVFKVTEQTMMGFEGVNNMAMSSGVGTQTSEIIAVEKGGGATVYAVLSNQTMKRTKKPGGTEEDSNSQTLEICRATQKGLYIDANIGLDDGKDDDVDVSPTVLDIRLPCAVGTSWAAGQMTYKDGFTIRPMCEAVGYETVQVAAGTFENCVKVVSKCPSGIEGYLQQEDQRLEIVSGDLLATVWYYPKIGIVKEVLNSTLRVRPEGQDQMAVLRMDTATMMELTEYKLGKRN